MLPDPEPVAPNPDPMQPGPMQAAPVPPGYAPDGGQHSAPTNGGGAYPYAPGPHSA